MTERLDQGKDVFMVSERVPLVLRLGRWRRKEDGEGRYTLGYDVPRVALTWMHLPPFARAIILSARLNATPVYAQVTSSLSLSLSLSRLLALSSCLS